MCAQVSYQELSAISQIKNGARRVVVNNTQGDRTFGGRLAALSLTDPDIKRTLSTDGGVDIVGLGVGGSSIGFCAPPGLSITVPRANHFIGKSQLGLARAHSVLVYAINLQIRSFVYIKCMSAHIEGTYPRLKAYTKMHRQIPGRG